MASRVAMVFGRASGSPLPCCPRRPSRTFPGIWRALMEEWPLLKTIKGPVQGCLVGDPSPVWDVAVEMGGESDA